MDYEELHYALDKQVPDIAVRTIFDTSFGELQLSGTDAKKIGALTDRLLRAKLKRMERLEDELRELKRT